MAWVDPVRMGFEVQGCEEPVGADEAESRAGFRRAAEFTPPDRHGPSRRFGPRHRRPPGKSRAILAAPGPEHKSISPPAKLRR